MSALRTALAAAVVAALAACGSSAAAEPWRSSHPDPAGMTFDEAAPGLCAVTVQFPEQAPAAVEYLGATYVQRARTPAPAAPPGKVVGRSAAWVVSVAGSTLYVDTGPALFRYVASGGC